MAVTADAPGLYKWLVVLASFMQQVLISSVMTSVGVFYVIFRQHLAGSSTLISLASSVCIAVTYAIGPLAGYLINRYGYRIVSIAGGVAATLGLSLTAFATNPWHLVITFGILSGIGMGMTYMGGIVAVGQYFTKRRPFAMGISVTGMGIGPIVSPPFMRMLEKYFGWRGAIFFFSGIYLHTIFFSAFLRPVRMSGPRKNYKKDNDIVLSNKREDVDLYHQTRRISLSDITVVIYLIETLVFSLALGIIQVHLGAFALPLGYSTDQAAMLIFSMGIGSACSRIILGILLQIFALDPLKVYIVASMLLGAFTISYPFGANYVSLVAIALMIGLFSASYGNLPPLIIINLVGMENFGLGYGCAGLIGSVGFIIAGPLSGWIYDSTKYYSTSFFVAGGVFLLAGLMLILVAISLHLKNHKTPLQKSAPEDR